MKPKTRPSRPMKRPWVMKLKAIFHLFHYDHWWFDQKKNRITRIRTNGGMDWPTNRRTNGQTHVKRCEDASRNEGWSREDSKRFILIRRQTMPWKCKKKLNCYVILFSSMLFSVTFWWYCFLGSGPEGDDVLGIAKCMTDIWKILGYKIAFWTFGKILMLHNVWRTFGNSWVMKLCDGHLWISWVMRFCDGHLCDGHLEKSWYCQMCDGHTYGRRDRGTEKFAISFFSAIFVTTSLFVWLSTCKRYFLHHSLREISNEKYRVVAK